jgi:molecular chaperone GrpE
MSEHQERPAPKSSDQAPQAEVVDEASFDDGAAEMEADSEVAEQSAEDLSALLEQARAKADEHYEQMVRAHAELDNLKKRHARDLENAHKFALDKFVADLLGVWDSLELGRNAARDEAADVEKLREGTELTLWPGSVSSNSIRWISRLTPSTTRRCRCSRVRTFRQTRSWPSCRKAIG